MTLTDEQLREWRASLDMTDLAEADINTISALIDEVLTFRGITDWDKYHASIRSAALDEAAKAVSAQAERHNPDDYDNEEESDMANLSHNVLVSAWHAISALKTPEREAALLLGLSRRAVK